MITKSKEANNNYIAKVVRLKGVRKHENADRLQCVDIDFQTVITGLDAKDGDIYVFFPIECKINLDFLISTGSLRPKEASEGEPEQTGFFERNGRVKATRLRGEKSMGYIVPIQSIKDFFGDFDESDYINEPFDTINGTLVCEKFVIAKKEGTSKSNKSPQLSRLIDGQVHLHKDTDKLEPNVWKISPEHIVSITYKTHGTSWWVSNVKVKKYLTWYERVLRKLGVKIQDTEYDYVYGSRKVVKNKSLGDPKQKDHFYGYDLWEDIKDEVKEHIPKGFTLYGEALGFTKTGVAIQKGYDYGCEPKQMKLEIYRITQTNEDGFVTELSHGEVAEFCTKTGLTQSKTLHYGKAYWLLPEVDAHAVDWTEKLIAKLRADYTEKDCHMCVNDVPEEGIVLRVDDLFNFVAFKLKSFRFLEWESKELDKGEVADIEDRESELWVADEATKEVLRSGGWEDETNIKDEEE